MELDQEDQEEKHKCLELKLGYQEGKQGRDL